MMGKKTTTCSRGQPLRDLRMYYSDEHRYVLAFCAKRANRILLEQHGLCVDPEELMAEGWWRCLRRRPSGDLKRQTIGHTISVMIYYAVHFYLCHNGRTRAGAFPDLDDKEGLDRLSHEAPTPCEWVVLTEDYEGDRQWAHDLLARLDPLARRIVRQRVFQGLSFARIGAREALASSRVHQIYHTALGELR